MAGKNGPAKKQRKGTRRAEARDGEVEEAPKAETGGRSEGPTDDVAEPPEPPQGAPEVSVVARRWERVATALAVAVCALVVGWLVSLPFGLAGADAVADEQLRKEVAKELPRDASGGPPSEAAVSAWVVEHGDEFSERKAPLAAAVRESCSLPFGDSRVVFPGGYDAFLWMRHARNLIEKGTSCDAVVDGKCWDTMTLAPVGSEMVYARSVHIVAIAALHVVLDKLFGLPMELSAALLPCLVAGLAVIPAFFIGRRIGGRVCGVVGALFAIGNAPAVSRMMAPDNDVWNVALPLTMSALLLASLYSEKPRARWAFVGAGGVVSAIQLASWSGGVFSHAILLGTGMVGLGLATVSAVRSGQKRPWQDPSIRNVALILAAYVVVSSLGLALLGGGNTYSEIWLRIKGVLLPVARTGQVGFASGLDTAAEMVGFGWLKSVDRVGRWPFVACAGMGMTWMFLPRGPWQRSNGLPVLGAALCTGILWMMDEAPRWAILWLLFAPGALVALRSALVASPSQRPPFAPVLVALWGCLGTYMMVSINRFELLATPMLGLSAIAAIDRAAGWLRGALAERVGERGARAVYLLGFGALACGVSRPVTYAHEVASNQLPRLTSAWHDTLVQLREQSSKDAIINVWWDQGHWAKYYGERRVNADGGVLRSHVHHWFSRALLAPSEEEAIGLLRMLDCASDPGPLAGGEQAAFGKLTGFGLNMDAAYSLVAEIARLDREAARQRLKEAGLDETEASSVLEATHCTPPEAFLALDSQPLLQPYIWTRLAQWRPGQRKRDGVRYAYPGLLPCTPFEGGLRCRVGARFQERNIQGFVFDTHDPSQSRLHVQAAGGGPPRTEAPVALYVASHGKIETIPTESSNGVGVLIDLDQRGVVVGAPDLVASMFTRLMLLPAEYSPRFERVDEHRDALHYQVRSWRLRW